MEYVIDSFEIKYLFDRIRQLGNRLSHVRARFAQSTRLIQHRHPYRQIVTDSNRLFPDN